MHAIISLIILCFLSIILYNRIPNESFLLKVGQRNEKQNNHEGFGALTVTLSPGFKALSSL